MFPIYFFLIAIVGSIVHVLCFHAPIIATLLLYFLVVTIGLQGIFAFTGHLFKSDDVAKNIGWPTGNPFQLEIAFANLAFGIMGVLCIWLRGNFWLATIIGKTIFLWGAAFVHIRDIKIRKNLNIYNAGPVLYAGILLPVIWIILSILMYGM